MLLGYMKRLGFSTFALAVVMTCAPAAWGDSITEFAFSFSSTDKSVSGSGTLNVTLNADGASYTATGGSITLPDPTVSNTTSGFTGSFALDPGTGDSVYASAGMSPDGSNYYLSSSGYFYFDDQLYYPQPNADLNGFFLDVGGLLFTNGASTPEEINLYQSGSYVYYENNGMNEAVNFTLTELPSSDTLTAAVPLPSAAGLGLTMLAGFGLVGFLRNRFRSMSRMTLQV